VFLAENDKIGPGLSSDQRDFIMNWLRDKGFSNTNGGIDRIVNTADVLWLTTPGWGSKSQTLDINEDCP
jgi:hypothetical protein